MGFNPTAPIQYDKDYYSLYCELDKTQRGRNLINCRTEFVRKYYSGKVLDVGIGGGGFVKQIDGYGYDICRPAIDWLVSERRYKSLYNRPSNVDAFTFWDSLEHMVEPDKALEVCGQYAFITIPVAESGEEWIESHHYKPGEHIWYWSRGGFIMWIQRLGFILLEYNSNECQLGRSKVMTFAIKRFG